MAFTPTESRSSQKSLHVASESRYYKRRKFQLTPMEDGDVHQMRQPRPIAPTFTFMCLSGLKHTASAKVAELAPT